MRKQALGVQCIYKYSVSRSTVALIVQCNALGVVSGRLLRRTVLPGVLVFPGSCDCVATFFFQVAHPVESGLDRWHQIDAEKCYLWLTQNWRQDLIAGTRWMRENASYVSLGSGVRTLSPALEERWHLRENSINVTIIMSTRSARYSLLHLVLQAVPSAAFTVPQSVTRAKASFCTG